MSNKIVLKVATFNIHACVGTDGRHNPQRIAEVIKAVDADIIGLQEVESHSSKKLDSQLGFFELATGYQVVTGHTIVQSERTYGNALLTRHPVRAVRQIDLSVAGFEPRAIMDVQFNIQGSCARILNTHLGLGFSERRTQFKRLLTSIAGIVGPIILMGDFNEWWPWSRNLKSLQRALTPTPHISSFPSRFPILALDRIWVNRSSRLRQIMAYTSPLAKRASDHLPVLAKVELPKRVACDTILDQ